MMRVAALIGASAMVAGCAVGPDYRRPAAPPAEAAQLQDVAGNSAVVASPMPDDWWKLFADPELDRLITRALSHNTDLRQAAANLQKARAYLRGAEAARLPTADASARYTRNRASIGANPPANFDYYTAGYDASYEVDLFGGVSRSTEAARGDAAAAQATLDAARVAVAAETASAYIAACGNAAEADVARETARLQTDSFDLTDRRVKAGRGTIADVEQARLLLEQAQAQIPQFEAEHRAALYALATLAGDTPDTIGASAAAQCRKVPSVAQPLPIGDGAAMLARRPDVRRAERQLAADTARIGVATAALYPSVKLLGSATLGAARPGDLLDSASTGYQLGPLISWNFPFNGAARAQLRAARAQSAATLAAFDGAVLAALKETDQALARTGGALQREAALRRAAAASIIAAEVERARFDKGSDSFFQLLDAERQRAIATAALTAAELDRADSQIAVFQALGGGWQSAPVLAEETPSTH